MKKIQSIIISLLILITTNSLQAALFEAPNPYSFGPQGRAVSDLRDFAKPKQSVSILPNRPVVATDSEGNRVYYTPDGKMTLSISKDGSMSFSIGGVSKTKNNQGELTGITRTIRGSGLRQVVKNEDDQIIGYKTLNGDGKTAATYDKDNNLTATYHYTGQGAKLDYIQNEMTKGRTYYDDFGRAKAEVDFDGYILATYQYQDICYEYGADGKTIETVKRASPYNDERNVGIPVSKKTYELSLSGNEDRTTEYYNADITYKITYYRTDNREDYVAILEKDANGDDKEVKILDYQYGKNEKGVEVLYYVLETLTGNKTFYKDNKKDVTKNDHDAVITQYYDDKVVNISNVVNEDGSRSQYYSEVTMFDIAGKELYTTFKNIEYNDDGTIGRVKGLKDEILEEYVYKTDKDGNKIVDSDGRRLIDYVINYSDEDYSKNKTYTWYEDNKPKYTTSSSERPESDTASNILKDFSWNGNTLVYTFDRTTEYTKWYNEEKDWVYETLNERIVNKNIYNNGQLIGKWNAQKGECTVLINERSWITITVDEEPTAAFIVNIIENSDTINKSINSTYQETLNINEILTQKDKFK